MVTRAQALGYPKDGTPQARVEWVARSIVDNCSQLFEAVSDDSPADELVATIAADCIELGKIFGFDPTDHAPVDNRNRAIVKWVLDELTYSISHTDHGDEDTVHFLKRKEYEAKRLALQNNPDVPAWIEDHAAQEDWEYTGEEN